MRELEENEVTFTISVEPEDIPVVGNCSAIDSETDKEIEDWIFSELENGNIWAWAWVTVTAHWKGFSASDYLGACSYESEEAFRKGGYFEDMKAEALHNLNSELKIAFAAIEELL
ncbi:MAG: hypothetical protein NUV65_06900 [Candidatus Roizmanbacteria bacterium]|nr:hypothetical protein [Candidatus Roizmanbacteria bacterium]